MKRLSQLLLPLLLAASVGTASAATIGYSFTGTVLDDSAGRDFAQFSGSLLFDSSATDLIADPGTAAYAQAGVPFGLQIQFDAGPQLVFDSSFFVLVSNDLGGGDDLGFLGTDAAGDSLSLNLIDLLGGLFTSDALPTQALSLADFGWNTLRWESGGELLQGWLTSFRCTLGCGVDGGPGDPGSDPPPTHAVPAPSSLLLLLVALALLHGRSRRQERSS